EGQDPDRIEAELHQDSEQIIIAVKLEIT
ncbi:unnamed protein product, partial [Rotaria sordida]